MHPVKEPTRKHDQQSGFRPDSERFSVVTGFFHQNERLQVPIHRLGVWHPESADERGGTPT